MYNNVGEDLILSSNEFSLIYATLNYNSLNVGEYQVFYNVYFQTLLSSSIIKQSSACTSRYMYIYIYIFMWHSLKYKFDVMFFPKSISINKTYHKIIYKYGNTNLNFIDNSSYYNSACSYISKGVSTRSYIGLFCLALLYVLSSSRTFFLYFTASYTYKSTCTSTTSSDGVGFFVRRTRVRRTNVRACFIQRSLLLSLLFQIKWCFYKIYTINCFIY